MHNHSGFTLRQRILCVVCILAMLPGCQLGLFREPNFYHASNIPQGLRVLPELNPQEVDLTRFASAQGSPDEIGPGDHLEISIAVDLKKDNQMMISARVSDDGTANIPNLGRIRLAGYEPQSAELIVRSELMQRGLYMNPTVTVRVEDKKVNRVRVVGAVQVPGEYELPPNSSDIVTAIAKAGGLAENAGPDVTVRNPALVGRQRRAIAGQPGSQFSTVSSSNSGGMNSYKINLVSSSQDVAGSSIVADGGVVMVHKRDPDPIRVTGLVREPGPQDFPIGKPITVVGAISEAGGRSNQLADKILVIRPLAEAGQRAVIQVSYRRAKRNPKVDLVLGPGDIVSVEQTPSTVALEAFQLIRFGINGSAGLF